MKAVEHFVFTEADKVGESLIDHQHEQIIVILNCLIAATTDSAYAVLYERLKDACEKHFNDEERIVSELGKQDAPLHNEEHRAILDKLWQYRPSVIGWIKSQQFVKTVFGPLIIGHDLELNSWLRKKTITRPYRKQ